MFNFQSQAANSSLPPKPLQQQKQSAQPSAQTNSNSIEYKHPVEVENLHEGKPVNWSRDSNKNELLNKLFGDSAASQSSTIKQSPQFQTKLDKVDDIFGGAKSSPTPPASSKVNLLPWEIQDINYNTSTNAKREKSMAKSNGNKINSNTTNTKQDHFDFFSKLNSKSETINNSSFKTPSSMKWPYCVTNGWAY